MPKPRTCPHCQMVQDLENGLTFSESYGLLCGSCGKVIYPTTYTEEIVIDDAIKARNGATTHPAYTTWNRNQATAAPYDSGHYNKTSYTSASPQMRAQASPVQPPAQTQNTIFESEEM